MLCTTNFKSKPRGRPRPPTTFFVRPKKVAKETPPQSAIPSGFPALLGCSGGCATRPGVAHKTCLPAELEQCSPKSPEQPSATRWRIRGKGVASTSGKGYVRMAYHWIMGLLISLFFGYVYTDLVWLVIADIAKPKLSKDAKAKGGIPSWVTGFGERLFFTILVAMQAKGVLAAMMGWLALKLAANWNHGSRGSESDNSAEAEIRANAIRAILSGLTSMLFAYWGGRFAQGG